jgi:hypothetical protein
MHALLNCFMRIMRCLPASCACLWSAPVIRVVSWLMSRAGLELVSSIETIVESTQRMLAQLSLSPINVLPPLEDSGAAVFCAEETLHLTQRKAMLLAENQQLEAQIAALTTEHKKLQARKGKRAAADLALLEDLKRQAEESRA